MLHHARDSQCGEQRTALVGVCLGCRAGGRQLSLDTAAAWPGPALTSSYLTGSFSAFANEAGCMARAVLSGCRLVLVQQQIGGLPVLAHWASCTLGSPLPPWLVVQAHNVTRCNNK